MHVDRVLGERIGRALVEQKGFTSVGDSTLVDAEPLDADGFDFVGVRLYWGSMVACAVLTAPGEDLGFVRERQELFCRFSRSLKPHVGSVHGARLGTFGTLVVVAHAPPSSEFQRALRSLRCGSVWRKEQCVTWLMDVPGRAVIPHRGIPFGMLPGREFLVRQLPGAT